MAEDSTLPNLTPENTQPANPDAATTAPEAPPSKGMHELSGEERAEFLSTGKTPTDGKTADSSTAPAKGKKAAETAASTSEAASETAAPGKDKKARNSEENRVAELLEDRRRDRARADQLDRDNFELRKRLEALEAGTKPKADGTTDSSTVADPSEPKWKKYRAMPGAPKISDFADPDDWGAAMAAFVSEQLTKDVIESTLSQRDKVSHEQAALHREMDTVINVAADRLEADTKAHADLVEKVHPKLRDLVPLRMLPEGQQPTPDHFIKDCITFDGDHPLQLHAFYSTDEGWAEWVAMRQMDRRGIERTIARRDLSFASTPGSTAAAPKAAAKTFTKAPPPPEKSGPKTAGAADAAESAMKSGDFQAFRDEMDARDPAGAQRFGRRRATG